LFIALIIALPGVARAQSFAVDASINPGTGRGGEFKNYDALSWRVAASLTGRLTPRMGLFVELAADPMSLLDAEKADCVPSSRGGCAPTFPDLVSGYGLVGVESGRQTASRFEVRAGLGGGMVSANHTRAGVVVAQADAGLFATQHVGLVLGLRALMIPKFDGDRLTVRSALVGLRIR
jgi:hypothetical protein